MEGGQSEQAARGGSPAKVEVDRKQVDVPTER